MYQIIEEVGDCLNEIIKDSNIDISQLIMQRHYWSYGSSTLENTMLK